MSIYRRDIPNRQQMQLPWSPGSTMSTARVAQVFKVSQETVRMMLESGELIGYRLRKVPKSPWRVFKDSVVRRLQEISSEADIEAYLESTQRESAKSATPASAAHRWDKRSL